MSASFHSLLVVFFLPFPIKFAAGFQGAPTPKCEDLYPFASAHKHTPSLKHLATCCPSKELKATTIGCKQAHRINRREKAAADWRHLKLWSVIKPNPGRSYTFNSDLFDFEAASPAQPSHPRRYA